MKLEASVTFTGRDGTPCAIPIPFSQYIEKMESEIDAALDEARKSQGSNIAIRIISPDGWVERVKVG